MDPTNPAPPQLETKHEANSMPSNGLSGQLPQPPDQAASSQAVPNVQMPTNNPGQPAPPPSVGVTNGTSVQTQPGGPGQDGVADAKDAGSQVQQMLLHVPENAKPGQKVTFAAPNGVYYQVAVPEGAKPGTPFRVAVPMVNPVNQWSYIHRMALQLQQAMASRQQMYAMNQGVANPGAVPGQTPIMGVRRARKTRKDKGRPRGPYRIRSERLYAELAAQEGVVPKTGAPPNVVRQRQPAQQQQQPPPPQPPQPPVQTQQSQQQTQEQIQQQFVQQQLMQQQAAAAATNTVPQQGFGVAEQQEQPPTKKQRTEPPQQMAFNALAGSNNFAMQMAQQQQPQVPQPQTEVPSAPGQNPEVPQVPMPGSGSNQHTIGMPTS
ncbi:hypothetical protein AAMO2058_000895600 [Amorphochlora amoebiformis]